jgi:hypothetical protein
MLTFTKKLESKAEALIRVQNHMNLGSFYAWGHHFHCGRGSPCGVMYHGWLREDESITQCVKKAEEVHGIPSMVAGLLNHFFAALSCLPDKGVSQLFVQQFYEAIPERVNLRNVPYDLILYTFDHAKFLKEYASEDAKRVLLYAPTIIENMKKYLDQTDQIKALYESELINYPNYYKGNDINALRKLITPDGILTNAKLHYYLDFICAGPNAKKPARDRWEKEYELAQVFLRLIRES